MGLFRRRENQRLTQEPVEDLDSATVTQGETTVSLSDVRVSARVTGGRFDLEVHHPDFEFLPPDEREALARLAVEATLGQAATEVLVRSLTPAVAPPIDAFALSGLRALVPGLGHPGP